MNGYDANALEEAVRLKEQRGAKVTAVSVGHEGARPRCPSSTGRGAVRPVLPQHGAGDEQPAESATPDEKCPGVDVDETRKEPGGAPRDGRGCDQRRAEPSRCQASFIRGHGSPSPLTPATPEPKPAAQPSSACGADMNRSIVAAAGDPVSGDELVDQRRTQCTSGMRLALTPVEAGPRKVALALVELVDVDAEAGKEALAARRKTKIAHRWLEEPAALDRRPQRHGEPTRQVIVAPAGKAAGVRSQGRDPPPAPFTPSSRGRSAPAPRCPL